MKHVTRLSIAELRKGLNTLSQQELVDLVIKCSGLSKEVESLLALRFKGQKGIEQLHQHYRKQIKDQCFPDRGFGKLSLSEAKKAISDFQKICSDRKLTFDLMLFYVEMGVTYTNKYGDIHEKFYNSIGSMYEQVIKWVNEDMNSELYLEHRERLYDVVRNNDYFGRGFHEDLVRSYYSIKWLKDNGKDVRT